MAFPSLDVTDVLDDPDFLDATLEAYRATSAETAHGLSVAIGVWVPFSGVVIPDADDDLVQSAEGDALDGAITIYTRFPLTAGNGDGAQADRVRWGNGGTGTYRVVAARGWRYGQGYTQAVCTLADLNPTTRGSANGSGHLG